MAHRGASLLALSLCFACTPAPAADDEAGVTTVMSGESDASASTTGTGTEASTLPGTETAPPDDSATLFIPPTDEPVSPDECDAFEQNCPVGEKCVPYVSSGGSWDANKCVPILGDQAAGEPCTSDGIVEATDNCDATSICWDVQEVDGELVGVCTPQCTGNADTPMCPPGYECYVGQDAAIAICWQTCDPIVQDCAEGLGCFWANTDFQCIVTSENIPTGAPCGYINDCAPGNLCADAAVLPSCAGSACCTKYCNLPDGDAGCVEQPGTACVPFFEQGTAPAGYEHVGVCIVPG